MMKEKTLTLKNNLKKISIDFFKTNLPDLKNITEAKAIAIGKWLSNEILQGLDRQKIKSGQLLPSKAEFAYTLGVSIGTVQNALKYCEDFKCIEAKPCIGTIVKDKNSSVFFNKKTSSKKEKIIFDIIQYIKSENFKIDDEISSPKIISEKVNIPVNSVRSALESLCSRGYLSKNNGHFFVYKNFQEDTKAPEIETLVDKTVKELKEYISKNCQKGEKICSHAEFSKIFNISMSTIHTAFNILSKEGIIKTRRGQYGTTIMKMPDDTSVKPEMSIFAPASMAVNYYYEKVQAELKKIISKEYEIGDKLPSIKDFSSTLNVSPNTVRKALLKISEQGYVKSLRGRYGGTVVVDIPETEGQNFRWLAVNPKYVLNK